MKKKKEKKSRALHESADTIPYAARLKSNIISSTKERKSQAWPARKPGSTEGHTDKPFEYQLNPVYKGINCIQPGARLMPASAVPNLPSMITMQIGKPHGYATFRPRHSSTDYSDTRWRQILSAGVGRQSPKPAVPNLVISSAAQMERFRELTNALISKVLAYKQQRENDGCTMEESGWLDAEIKALAQGTIPGFAPMYSNIPFDRYPWRPHEVPHDILMDAAEPTALWLKDKLSIAGFARPEMFAPSRCFLAGTPYKVTFGGYTGLELSAPGADPELNVRAIIYHSIRAAASCNYLANSADMSRPYTIDSFTKSAAVEFLTRTNELHSRLDSDRLIDTMMHYIVLSRSKRQRVRNPDTLDNDAILDMQPVYRRYTDQSTGEQSLQVAALSDGYYEFWRLLAAPDSTTNQMITPIASAIEAALKTSNMYKMGTFSSTIANIMDFRARWPGKVTTVSTDQSTYDQHLTTPYILARNKAYAAAFKFTEYDASLFTALNYMPFLGQGWFNSDGNVIERWDCGEFLHSGLRITSIDGKVSMRQITIATIAGLYSKPYSWAERQIFDTDRRSKYYNPNGRFAYINSSDDNEQAEAGGFINWDEYVDYQKTYLGLDVKRDSFQSMLKQIAGNWMEYGNYEYPGSISHTTDYPIFTSLGSHWINQCLPERPSEVKEALYDAVLARMRNLTYNPLKGLYVWATSELLQDILPSWAFDERKLVAYVGSDAHQVKLKAEIEASSKDLSALKAIMRSATLGDFDAIADLVDGDPLLSYVVRFGFGKFAEALTEVNAISKSAGLNVSADVSNPSQMVLRAERMNLREYSKAIGILRRQSIAHRGGI